jgi:hypothetical protein
MLLGWYVAVLRGRSRNACRVSVGASEKGPLPRLRRRWEGSIKVNFREVGWEGVDWILLIMPVTSGVLL